MAIKTSGPLSINDIVAEFGGDPSHSLNEYYRGGGLVPESPVNSSIPTSGEISIEDFYGATNVVPVTYEIIGGGGGGAGGGNGAGNGSRGGTSSISGTGVTTVSSTGGIGGYVGVFGSTGGAPSAYGGGGSAGVNAEYRTNRISSGGPAPSTSYGAGGGGGGSNFSQPAGTGGGAASRITGSQDIVPGTVLTIVIGGRGFGGSSGAFSSGGSGAGGYAKITVLGVSTEYTTPGTYTQTV